MMTLITSQSVPPSWTKVKGAFCVNISCMMHIFICPRVAFLLTLFYRLDSFCACTGLTDQEARLIRYLHLWSQLPKAQMHKKEEVCHKCMITAVGSQLPRDGYTTRVLHREMPLVSKTKHLLLLPIFFI